MISSDINISDLILYEDADLLVINKPAGLLSIPDGYLPDLPHVRFLLEPEFGRVYIVHRLDRDTSGVMLVPRTRHAHHHLNAQFEERKVKKVYHAIVDGCPHWNVLTIDLPLRVNGDRHHRTVIAPLTGKPARTDCTIVKRTDLWSLVKCVPYTGYTHQIRAHLSAAGFPINCDPLYQPRQPSLQARGSIIDRLALHALQITFSHPATGLILQFTAPYPDDFSTALTFLGQPQSSSWTQSNS